MPRVCRLNRRWGHILSRTFALLVMGAFITNSEFRLSPEAPYPIGVYWFIMAFGFVTVWNKYPKPSSPAQANVFRVLKVLGVLALLYLALTFINPQGGVFGAYWGILGSIGWTYLVCAVIYFFSRDRLRYPHPHLGCFHPDLRDGHALARGVWRYGFAGFSPG